MLGIELHERALASAAATRWAEAEGDAWQSLEWFAREDGPDSPDVANLSNLLAEIAEAQAQYGVAEMHSRRACGIMARLGERCIGEAADGIRVEARLRLGLALCGGGRYREAQGWLEQALALAERTGFGLPAALNNLAVLSKCTADFTPTELLYRRGLRLVPPDSFEAATLHHNLGGLAHAQGRFASGEADARRAWEIRRSVLGENHPDTLADACAYAALLEHLGAGDWSERVYRHAAAVYEQVFGPEHLEIAMTLHNLAGLLANRGAADEADALYRRAAAIKEKRLGAVHPDTALTWHNHASLLAEIGRSDEARHLACRALEVLEVELPGEHPWLAASRELWAFLRPNM